MKQSLNFITTAEENQYDNKIIKRLRKKYSISIFHFRKKEFLTTKGFIEQKQGLTLYHITTIDENVLEIIKRKKGIVILDLEKDLSKYFLTNQTEQSLMGFYHSEKDEKGELFRWTNKKGAYIVIREKGIEKIILEVRTDSPSEIILNVAEKTLKKIVFPTRKKKRIIFRIEKLDYPLLEIKVKKILGFIPRIRYFDKRKLGVRIYSIKGKNKIKIIELDEIIRNNSNLFSERKEMQFFISLGRKAKEIIATNKKDERKIRVFTQNEHQLPFGLQKVKKPESFKNKKIISYFYEEDKKKLEKFLSQKKKNEIIVIHKKKSAWSLLPVICKEFKETETILADNKELQVYYLKISDAYFDENSKNCYKKKQTYTWNEIAREIEKIVEK